MKKLFNLYTIGGWAGIVATIYLVYFWFDTGIRIFVWLAIPVLIISSLWIWLGCKKSS